MYNVVQLACSYLKDLVNSKFQYVGLPEHSPYDIRFDKFCCSVFSLNFQSQSQQNPTVETNAGTPLLWWYSLHTVPRHITILDCQINTWPLFPSVANIVAYHSRCPVYSSIPPYCHLEQPIGECCKKPICEFDTHSGSFTGSGSISGYGIGKAQTWVWVWCIFWKFY